MNKAFRFVHSQSMKVTVSKEQEAHLSANEKIQAACCQENVLAFDIYHSETLIGFAMLRQYDDTGWFLWDYAIDQAYQNLYYGTDALQALIDHMETSCGLKEMTTTYIWGNNHAKHIYENLGFVETDVVDEPGCHEVNMIFQIRKDRSI